MCEGLIRRPILEEYVSGETSFYSPEQESNSEHQTGYDLPRLQETEAEWAEQFQTYFEEDRSSKDWGLLAQTIASDPFLDLLGQYYIHTWRHREANYKVIDSHGHTKNGGPFYRQGYIIKELVPQKAEAYLDEAEVKEIDGFAVTNHDTMDGVEKMMDKAKSTKQLIIPGVEQTTLSRDGRWVHILGLGIKPEKVERTKKDKFKLPTFKSISDNIKWILDHDGTPVAPHICWRGGATSMSAFEVTKYGNPYRENRLQGVEVAYPSLLRQAQLTGSHNEVAALTIVAQLNQLAPMGATDFHCSEDVGLLTTEVLMPCKSSKDFQKAIRMGQVRPFINNRGTIFSQKADAPIVQKLNNAVMFITGRGL